ncbi:MAG: caspase family protein, partial [Scytonema sp. PMC 1069.18]|nr:caspase family protein [Scytonema sp. PMC 1069.18]
MSIWSYKRNNFDRDLAVIIGINNYQKGIHPLKSAVNDATEIAKILEEDYEYKEVIKLFPPYGEATLEEIKKLLFETLPKKLQKPHEGNRLLFYFAGHGIARNAEDGPAGYLIPQDASVGELTTFLAMTDLHNALSTLNCHHLLVILDCCFAGTFRWSNGRQAVPILETVHREHYYHFIKNSAWQVITSAAHNQQAMDLLTNEQREISEGYVLHSPFAKALIEGLQGQADLNKDGVIVAPELYLYLRERLIEKNGKELQTPGLWPLRSEDIGEYIFTKKGFQPNQLKNAPPLDENHNPYRGLKPFEERHKHFFFGRDNLIKELLNRLDFHQFIAVTGTSGSGKSSLVKAGLIPRLRKNSQWYVLEPVRPGNSPFMALARAVLPLSDASLIDQLVEVEFLERIFKSKKEQAPGKSSQGEEINSAEALQEAKEFSKLAELWIDAVPGAKLLLIIDYFSTLKKLCQKLSCSSEEFQHLSKLQEMIQNSLNYLNKNLAKDAEFFQKIVATWTQDNAKDKVLLVIDQFEELITLSKRSQNDDNKQEQKQWEVFLERLNATMIAHPEQFKVVITVRSDFEFRFLDSAIGSYWKQDGARFSVRAMSSDELKQAIEGPALKQALYFEPPTLISALIDEVGQMPGSLPLLSFTLSELYIELHKKWQNQKHTGRALTEGDYKKLGGIVAALTKRATQEYESSELDDAHRGIIKRLMLRMVAIDGTEVTRRRVPISELNYANEQENIMIDEIIGRFVKARLLVRGQEEGKDFVEPAHDYLLHGWNKLQEWIEQERENLLLRQRLTLVANDWHQRQGALWTEEEGRLLQLKEVIKSNNNWLNKVETDFVRESIEERRKRLEENEQQRDEAMQGQVSALSALSEARFPDDQLGALIHILKAGRILQQLIKSSSPWVQEDIRLRTEVVLRQILSKVKEFNRLEDNDIPGQIQTLAFTTSNELVFIEQGRLLSLNSIYPQELILMESIVPVQNRPIIKFWQLDGRLENGGLLEYPLATWNPVSRTLAHFIYRSSQPQEKRKPNAIRLISLEGTEVILQSDERDHLMKFAFSPNGELVASGGWFGQLYLWDKDGRTIKSEQIGGGSINAIDFSSNGEMFVTGSNDGNIRFWNQQGEFIKTIERAHKDVIWDISFSPDGETLASVSTDTTVKIWKTDGTLLTTLNGHRDIVRALCFSSDGNTLASADDAGTVRLWKPNGAKLQSLSDHHTGSVYAVRFSPDGQKIATASGQGQLILSRRDGRLLRIWEKGQAHHGPITALNFSPNGKMLVTAAADREVKLWKLDGTD